jgi:putative transcription factor
MQCELCGKPATLRASIEGVTMSTCAACARFGTTLQAPVHAVKKVIAEPEPLLTVVDDAGMKVKAGREKLGLSQQDFALKLNEHQSVIHKIETGHHEPNLELARKLEKLLRITLIETVENVSVSSEKTKTGPVTIGDMLKIKNV